MDVLYFLKERTRLIRQYYEQAAKPFSETIRKIEAEEEPFVPPYSEDPEPAFFAEWVEANELLEVTGRSCVSMLSASLQLYLNAWDRILGLQCKAQFKAAFKGDGLIGGYRQCLAARLVLDWKECPADLAIIEQVVLARNRDQHPDSITTLRVTHADHDRARHPRPFFLNDKEAELYDNGDGAGLWMSPSLHVPREKLMEAISNVESLCEWLEEKMFDAKYPARHDSALPISDSAQDLRTTTGNAST
ncbi:MAG TPA: hypothetical protein DCP03_13690 [Polaromonas sp.]|uniref:hypothetical protein n=1 Tax=Polaromonas sp. UBA4122 TaxID=1947074 RepID=UPI000EEECA95|nr:hypothetical protein [Polaromonas sp. UBA4122]HAL39092.1 hypothetical protein [Polaromonas sp.]